MQSVAEKQNIKDVILTNNGLLYHKLNGRGKKSGNVNRG